MSPATLGLPFRDRREAGQRLAAALLPLNLADPLVLALPRGGVPVGFEVAQALAAPLDVLVVRKIGAPGQPEYGIGAVADGSEPQTVLNEDAMALIAPGADYVAAESARQLAEIERRRRAYRGDRPPVAVRDRVVVLVDDGIATGGTARVALKALKRAGAERVVLAVPVAPKAALEVLAREADHVVCLAAPEPFHAVGEHYLDFDQVSDAEVVRLLAAAAKDTVSSAAPSGSSGL